MTRALVFVVLMTCGCARACADDAAIVLDGELLEPAWKQAARSGAFLDPSGLPARPFSEARVFADREKLYFALYAADEDIEAKIGDHDGPVWLDDAFSLRLGAREDDKYQIDISAAGVITDVRDRDKTWESGAALGIERDGTVGDATDDDEEWVVEASLPLASIGVTARKDVRVHISRCDTPKGGKRSCGAWDGVIAAGR